MGILVGASESRDEIGVAILWIPVRVKDEEEREVEARLSVDDRLIELGRVVEATRYLEPRIT